MVGEDILDKFSLLSKQNFFLVFKKGFKHIAIDLSICQKNISPAKSTYVCFAKQLTAVGLDELSQLMFKLICPECKDSFYRAAG